MVENEEKKSELRPMMKISELVPYLNKRTRSRRIFKK